MLEPTKCQSDEKRRARAPLDHHHRHRQRIHQNEIERWWRSNGARWPETRTSRASAALICEWKSFPRPRRARFQDASLSLLRAALAIARSQRQTHEAELSRARFDWRRDNAEPNNVWRGVLARARVWLEPQTRPRTRLQFGSFSCFNLQFKIISYLYMSPVSERRAPQLEQLVWLPRGARLWIAPVANPKAGLAGAVSMPGRAGARRFIERKRGRHPDEQLSLVGLFSKAAHGRDELKRLGRVRAGARSSAGRTTSLAAVIELTCAFISFLPSAWARACWRLISSSKLRARRRAARMDPHSSANGKSV